MPAGRPTDYTPELIEKARSYLKEYEDEGDKIPSVVGLCKFLNRSRACVYRWAEEEGKEEFKDILENINELQSHVLINKGLSGEFNSNITKLVLGKHGYHDKQDQNVGGQKDNPVEMKWQVEVIDAKNADTKKA